MNHIEWEQLTHAQFVAALSDGLAERDRRTQELFSLGAAVAAPSAEKRGPGRPAGSANKTAREQQLEAAESGGVQ